MRRRFKPASEILAIAPRAISGEYDGADAEVAHIDTAASVVAIVAVQGPLEHHETWFFDSYDAIVGRVREAFADPDVAAVVLKIDSPGGDAAGATEATRQLRSMAQASGKKLWAYSDEACFSAAYSLASAADEIWLPETGGVGSVGVIAQVVDATGANAKAGMDVRLITSGARKADTHPDRKIDDAVLQALQTRVDAMADAFVGVVSIGRQMSTDAIFALEAGVFLGASAVEAGLADGVAGWDEFLQVVGESLHEDTMTKKTIATLQAAHDQALKAFNAAATPKTIKAARLAYVAAVQALAVVQPAPPPPDSSKDLPEDDDDEDDEDKPLPVDGEEGEDEESEEDPKCAKSKVKSEDEESEEDDEDDEEPEVKKMSARESLQLLALSKRVTGRKSLAGICGALEAFGTNVATSKKLAAKVQVLEASARQQDLSSILKKAQRDGRVSPAQAKSYLAKGCLSASDAAWVKGHVETLSKAVHTEEDEVKPDQSHGRQFSTSSMDQKIQSIALQGIDCSPEALAAYKLAKGN